MWPEVGWRLAEKGVGPLGGLGGDGVKEGVKEKGWEGRAEAGPVEEGLVGGEFEVLVAEAEGEG